MFRALLSRLGSRSPPDPRELQRGRRGVFSRRWRAAGDDPGEANVRLALEATAGGVERRRRGKFGRSGSVLPYEDPCVDRSPACVSQVPAESCESLEHDKEEVQVDAVLPTPTEPAAINWDDRMTAAKVKFMASSHRLHTAVETFNQRLVQPMMEKSRTSLLSSGLSDEERCPWPCFALPMAIMDVLPAETISHIAPLECASAVTSVVAPVELFEVDVIAAPLLVTTTSASISEHPLSAGNAAVDTTDESAIKPTRSTVRTLFRSLKNLSKPRLPIPMKAFRLQERHARFVQGKATKSEMQVDHGPQVIPPLDSLRRTDDQPCCSTASVKPSAVDWKKSVVRAGKAAGSRKFFSRGASDRRSTDSRDRYVFATQCSDSPIVRTVFADELFSPEFFDEQVTRLPGLTDEDLVNAQKFTPFYVSKPYAKLFDFNMREARDRRLRQEQVNRLCVEREDIQQRKQLELASSPELLPHVVSTSELPEQDVSSIDLFQEISLAEDLREFSAEQSAEFSSDEQLHTVSSSELLWQVYSSELFHPIVSSSDQPQEGCSPDQPQEGCSPDQPQGGSMPEQPQEGSSPGQLQEILSPDQLLDVSPTDHREHVSSSDAVTPQIEDPPQCDESLHPEEVPPSTAREKRLRWLICRCFSR